VQNPHKQISLFDKGATALGPPCGSNKRTHSHTVHGNVLHLNDSLEPKSDTDTSNITDLCSVKVAVLLEPHGDATVDIPDSSEASGENLVTEAQEEESPRILGKELGQKFSLHGQWHQTTPKSPSNLSKPSRTNLNAQNADFGESRTWNCSLHPTGVVAPCWNILFMVMLLYELIIFPLKAFPVPEEGFLSVMAWVSLVFWTTDVCMSMFMGYQSKSGEYVLKLSLILKNYAKTWMVPDVIIVSIDWASLVLSESNTDGLRIMRAGKTLRSIRLLQALRVVRLYKLRSLFRETEHHIDSLYLRILTSIGFNLLVILSSSHFIGCLWYWIGRSSANDGHNWVNIYLHNSTWEYSYMTSYHWALTQFTPGSMEVQPQNALERLFANLILMLGLIIFSSSVSSITNATNRLRLLHSTYTNQIWELRRFFKQERISPGLLHRVTKYSDAVIAPRVDHVNMHDVALLKLLPQSIHTEVVREIYDRHFNQHAFFKAYSQLDSFGMQSIYQHVTQASLAEDDVLFSPGQRADSMYFIITGVFCYVHAHDEKPVDVLAGMWCSEAALWTDWTHQGTMQGAQASDVVVLNSDKFRKEVKQQHHMSFALKYGNQFIDSMNAVLGLQQTEEEEAAAFSSEASSAKNKCISDLHTPPDLNLIAGKLFKNAKSKSQMLE